MDSETNRAVRVIRATCRLQFMIIFPLKRPGAGFVGCSISPASYARHTDKRTPVEEPDNFSRINPRG